MFLLLLSTAVFVGSGQAQNTPCRRNSDCSVTQICFNLTPNGTGFCISNPNFPNITTTTTTTTTTASPATAPRCPHLWTWYPKDNLCYFAIRGTFTFHQMQQACTNVWNGTVAAPADALQNYFIYHLYSGGTGMFGPYWLGVRRAGNIVSIPGILPQNQRTRTTTFASSSLTLSAYTNWRPGQPNNCCGADVSCVLADYLNPYAQWDDDGCSNARGGAVCQRYAHQTIV